MQNITAKIQEGKGGAVHRFEMAARKAEKRGDHERAAKLRANAEFLKSETPTIWG